MEHNSCCDHLGSMQLPMNSTLRAFGRAIHLCFTLYMIFVCSCLCYHCHGQGPCYDCNHFHCVCVNGNNSHLVIHVIFIIMFVFTIIVRNNSPCGHLVHDCGHLIDYHGCHHHVHDHGCLKPHLDILCMIFILFLKLTCTTLHKGFTLTFTWIYTT